MPHLFDNLPTDIIYYEIFPFLDYDSRVTANLMLPRKDRIGHPLKKDAALICHPSFFRSPSQSREFCGDCQNKSESQQKGSPSLQDFRAQIYLSHRILRQIQGNDDSKMPGLY